MRGKIYRFVLLIVDSLDDVRLFAHTGIGENSVTGSQIFQVRLERTDVGGGPVWNILSDAKIIRDLLHRIESGELSHSHAHGVARMDKTVGARHRTAVSTIRIRR